MECEAGSVSFPQSLAPCGTGLPAVPWAFAGRKELRNGRREEQAHLVLWVLRAEARPASHSLTCFPWQEWFHVRKGSFLCDSPAMVEL